EAGIQPSRRRARRLPDQVSGPGIDVGSVADLADLVPARDQVAAVRSAVEHAGDQTTPELVLHRRGPDVRVGGLDVGVDSTDPRLRTRNPALGVETGCPRAQ